MMRKPVLLLIFSIVLGCLSACANTQNYEAMLDVWIGKSEKELVMGWGIPDKQYQLDKNTRLISYTAYNTAYYPGTLSTCFGTGSRNAVFSGCSGSIPPTVETYFCETIFTLVNGRVSRWGHRGNNCRS